VMVARTGWIIGKSMSGKWPSRSVWKRVALVTLVAAAISISVSTGLRVLVGAKADTITIVVRLILPFIIAIPLALVWFTHLERLEKSYHELLVKAAELARRASVDPLTGLLNRRSFIEQFEAAMGHGISGHFLIIDIDYLKAINDRHGHPAGDEAILSEAEAVRQVLGNQSLIAGVGGDEFGAFMPRCDGLKRDTWKAGISGAATQEYRTRTDLNPESLSVTRGCEPCGPGLTFKDVLLLADAKLYGNKRGREESRSVSRPDMPSNRDWATQGEQ